jgi:hypothetical protein
MTTIDVLLADPEETVVFAEGLTARILHGLM